MKISVIGTGYVGLVAGTCFADAGHHVTCMDRDSSKIEKLLRGEVPIYEPGLEDIMKPAIKSKRLKFTSDIKSAVATASVVFVAVGTPETASGEADLGPTFSVLKDIAQNSKPIDPGAPREKKFVVLKSTVPVGTAVRARQLFKELDADFIEVVSNPEFLKEGAAIDDFLKPDRIIIGCASEAAQNVMSELYAPFVKNGHPIHFMDNASAELTKYAANAFLSIKISFINELARLADKAGADINMVRKGFTTDRRINPAFFYPGVGYGGSCFPKDVKALVSTGKHFGIPMRLTQAAEDVNKEQKEILFHLMKEHFGGMLKNKKIAIWGLSFKPRTDDVREAPALHLIELLVAAGAHVVAYDPVAGENAQRNCKAKFELGTNSMDICKGADALAVVTEWNEFRSPDFKELKNLMRSPAIFDGRNVFEPSEMKKQGIQYYCIGRKSTFEMAST